MINLDDAIEFCKFVCFCFLLGTVTLGPLLLGVNILEQRACSIYGQQSGVPTHYEHFNDCYITAGGVVTTLDHYKDKVVANQIQNRSN